MFSKREKMDDTWWAEGLIYEGHPSSVEMFKKYIVFKPHECAPYFELISYFDENTHEYGKALEVMNKCLDSICDLKQYVRVLKLRQNLLARIVGENYWVKL